MPLFPELRPYLQAVLDELLEDFDLKTDRLSEQPIITRYRDTNSNLRTQLLRIIKRAGVKPWPKLFQNLRATRAELADAFPSAVAADWLGHSDRIAAKHYRQTTDEHFARALQWRAAKTLQSPTVTGETDGNEWNGQMEVSLGVHATRELWGYGVEPKGLEPSTSSLQS